MNVEILQVPAFAETHDLNSTSQFFISVIPSVEKMKTQDPSSLKQVLRSHINDPFLKQ